MVSSSSLSLLASLLAPFALASPLAQPQNPTYEHRVEVVADGASKRALLVSREPGAPMIRRNGLVARTETKSISLEQTLENELLFDSDDIPLFLGPSIQVSCAKCCSKGSIDAIIPSDITDILNPKFRVELNGIEAIVELDVVVSAESSFEVPLLKLPPGVGNIQIPGFKAGLFIDLVLLFEFSAQVDISGGFYMKIPDGSFFEIDISAEGIHNEDFTGIVSQPLPVVVNNNGTEIAAKIDLQLRASFGISAGTNELPIPLPDLPGDVLDIPDFGAGAEVGAFINLIEYIASIAPTDDCALEATEELNVNVGAFAEIGVSFEEDFFGVQPSVTTTLFVHPLPSACLVRLGDEFPVRLTPLPTAGECKSAPPPVTTLVPGVPPPVVTDEPTTIAITSVITKTETICSSKENCPYAGLAPTAVAYAVKRQEAPIITSLTAKGCMQPLAPCPDDLFTELVFPATVCPAAPTAGGNCFAGITNVPTLTPTSITKTKPPTGTGGPKPPCNCEQIPPIIKPPITEPPAVETPIHDAPCESCGDDKMYPYPPPPPVEPSCPTSTTMVPIISPPVVYPPVDEPCSCKNTPPPNTKIPMPSGSGSGSGPRPFPPIGGTNSTISISSTLSSSSSVSTSSGVAAPTNNIPSPSAPSSGPSTPSQVVVPASGTRMTRGGLMGIVAIVGVVFFL